MRCVDCNELNEYAAPNLPGDAYRCYSCRDLAPAVGTPQRHSAAPVRARLEHGDPCVVGGCAGVLRIQFDDCACALGPAPCLACSTLTCDECGKELSRQQGDLPGASVG